MQKDIDGIILGLIEYAKRYLCLDQRDAITATNRVLEIVGLPGIEEAEPVKFTSPDDALAALFCALGIDGGEAAETGDKVMAALSLPLSAVDDRFGALVKKGGRAATDWLYGYSVKNSYVKRAVLDKNPRFDIGGLTVTINKAKPEFKDPKKAAAMQSGNYPKCVICRENEGYGPKTKRTLVTASIKLGGEDYFWQYSPFGYFNEHGIAVNAVHTPMYVDRTTFGKLMDFVDMFPHYFIGCNAALPRIGGSVLAHDHFQGGGETLPLHRADIRKRITHPDYKNVEIGIVDWSGSVVRIIGDRDDVTELADIIREGWVDYSAPELGIVCADGDGVHSAISPTVTKVGSRYAMNIILRNNITTDRYPDGVFHAHPEFHCIKKESIGLIEAQGLFILPGRLERELGVLGDCLKKGCALPDEMREFDNIYEETKALYRGDADDAIKRELGSVCDRILKNTAVFKTDDKFVAFLKGLGFEA